jgi:hypothetical protein
VAPASITTEIKNELQAPPGHKERGRRQWSIAEMSGARWFVAEDRAKRGGDVRRFISPRLRELAPLIRNNSTGSWRCFAYLADVNHAPEGMVFEEILEVTDLRDSGMLLFQLKSGLFGTEAYGANSPSFVGNVHVTPEPVVTGTQIFRWWPASM